MSIYNSGKPVCYPEMGQAIRSNWSSTARAQLLLLTIHACNLSIFNYSLTTEILKVSKSKSITKFAYLKIRYTSLSKMCKRILICLKRAGIFKPSNGNYTLQPQFNSGGHLIGRPFVYKTNERFYSRSDNWFPRNSECHKKTMQVVLTSRWPHFSSIIPKSERRLRSFDFRKKNNTHHYSVKNWHSSVNTYVVISTTSVCLLLLFDPLVQLDLLVLSFDLATYRSSRRRCCLKNSKSSLSIFCFALRVAWKSTIYHSFIQILFHPLYTYTVSSLSRINAKYNRILLNKNNEKQQ